MVAEPGFVPGSGASVWIWSHHTAVNRDPFKATETASHIMCFPSLGIFIAMRYNIIQVRLLMQSINSQKAGLSYL